MAFLGICNVERLERILNQSGSSAFYTHHISTFVAGIEFTFQPRPDSGMEKFRILSESLVLPYVEVGIFTAVENDNKLFPTKEVQACN